MLSDQAMKDARGVKAVDLAEYGRRGTVDSERQLGIMHKEHTGSL